MSTITWLLLFPDGSPDLAKQIKTSGPIRCLPNSPLELIDPKAILGALKDSRRSQDTPTSYWSARRSCFAMLCWRFSASKTSSTPSATQRSLIIIWDDTGRHPKLHSAFTLESWISESGAGGRQN